MENDNRAAVLEQGRQVMICVIHIVEFCLGRETLLFQSFYDMQPKAAVPL